MDTSASKSVPIKEDGGSDAKKQESFDAVPNQVIEINPESGPSSQIKKDAADNNKINPSQETSRYSRAEALIMEKISLIVELSSQLNSIDRSPSEWKALDPDDRLGEMKKRHEKENAESKRKIQLMEENIEKIRKEKMDYQNMIEQLAKTNLEEDLKEMEDEQKAEEEKVMREIARQFKRAE